MFGININREWTDRDQDVVDRQLTEPGFDARDYREAHRHRAPLGEFEEVFTGEIETIEEMGYTFDYPVMETRCPFCGSIDCESESIDDYGGTTSGWTTCGFCGYSTSWADLSAVI